MEINHDMPVLLSEGKTSPKVESDLTKLKTLIQDSENRDNQFNGLTQIKKTILEVINQSDQLNEFIQNCLDINLFEEINNIIIKKFEDLDLLFEAVWILINACCGTQEEVYQIIKTDILSTLTEIIQQAIKHDNASEKSINVAYHCVWVIGNIATDSAQHRDECLEKDLANLIVAFNKKYSAI